MLEITHSAASAAILAACDESRLLLDQIEAELDSGFAL
jgi:hypothetical protein